MHKQLIAIAFFAASLISANVQAQKTVGNGNVTTQDRTAGSFNEVHSQGSFNIVLTDGNDHKVSVEAEENLQDLVITEVQGNSLQIRTKKGVNFRATKDITIHVTAPSLTEIALSGSGNVKSTNKLDGSSSFKANSSGSGNMDLEVETSKLSTAISGSGNITLKGSTQELDARISGSGNIKAKNLQSDITSIKISGSGSAEVVANEKLESKIAGSGDVRYWGNASVDAKTAGSGSIRKQ